MDMACMYSESAVAYRLLEGGGHQGVQGNDEVAAGSEHWVCAQHVVQLADGVPAGQEHQDGPRTVRTADHLDQLQHQVHVDHIMIHVTQSLDYVRGILPLGLQR